MRPGVCPRTTGDVRRPILLWQRIAPVAIAMTAGVVGGAIIAEPNKGDEFRWVYLSFALISFVTSYALPHAATSSGLAYMLAYTVSIHLIGPIDQSSTSAVGFFYHLILCLPLIGLGRLGRWARLRLRHASKGDG
jgi:ABC-type polysaccharide/polyol phosphate export permease